MSKLSTPERIFIYSWFKDILSHELSEPQVQYYYTGTFEPLFDLLAELGFATATHQLQSAFRQLQQDPHGQLELAADFAQLFLLDGQSSALPYASAYLNEEQSVANLSEMDKLLRQYQLAVNRATNEPSDHLCVYLEIFLKLLEDQSIQPQPTQQQPTQQQPIQQQQDFVQRQLLTWLPHFVDKSQKIALKSQIYPIIVVLLADFITLDNRIPYAKAK